MSRRRKRRRPFPTGRRGPGDDDTIIYKISGDDLFVGGETVFISAEGIQVVASLSGNYEDQNGYTFVDDDGIDIGGLYGRDDAGQNVIGLRAADPPGNGDDVLLQLIAEADAGGSAAARVSIAAERDGESGGTYITVAKDNNSSEIDIIAMDSLNGRVRISPKINLLGASLELCDVYIKSTYFIIKFNDGGTTRYKYLDLSGTGTGWVHSTTEP